MSSNYVYPEAAEVYRIQADLTAKTEKDMLGMKLFPTKNCQTYEIRWVQKDNAYGLMALRGIDGKPQNVVNLGENEYFYKPGVYGESMSVTEAELLKRADPMNPTQRIDVSELVMERQGLLNTRKATRKEYNTWQLLTTGTLSIKLPGPNNPTGAYSVTFPLQTYTAPISWINLSTATPIANLQSLQQKFVGHGVSFGPESTIYVNQITANALVNNSNASDLGGRKGTFGQTITNSLQSINGLFAGLGLPQIEIYDQFFQTQLVAGPVTNPTTQTQKYIPNYVGTLIGKRLNGDPVGHWINAITLENQAVSRQYNNPQMALGEYAYVKDYVQGVNAPRETPGRLEVHIGGNFGMVLEYPASVVSCTF